MLNSTMLNSGAHTLGVWLGFGWYSKAQNVAPSVPRQYGPPRFNVRLDVTMADGSVQTLVSNTSGAWHMRDSEIVLNSVYNGEIVDAQLSDPNWASPSVAGKLSWQWRPAQALDSPTKQLVPQVMQPIRINGVIKPIRQFQESGTHCMHTALGGSTGSLSMRLGD